RDKPGRQATHGREKAPGGRGGDEERRSARRYCHAGNVAHRCQATGNGAVFLAIGLVLVFGSILVGYTMHGGAVAVLIQVSELIIIGGAALGAAVIGNKPKVVLAMFKETIAL